MAPYFSPFVWTTYTLTHSLSQAMDTDAKEDAPKRTRKVKKQVRKGDLPIASGTSTLDASLRSSLMEKEANMVMEDKLVADTEEKKNELETYIYDLRAKLDDQYAELASTEEKSALKQKLEAAEVRQTPLLGIADLRGLSSFCRRTTDDLQRIGSTTKATTQPRASM